jgi:hypothetical protein
VEVDDVTALPPTVLEVGQIGIEPARSRAAGSEEVSGSGGPHEAANGLPIQPELARDQGDRRSAGEQGMDLFMALPCTPDLLRPSDVSIECQAAPRAARSAQRE